MDQVRATWVREAVARWEAPLCRYAGRLARDPERGRDWVQEAFLRLCAQDPAVLEGRLGEWLFTVVRNLAVDASRKEGRMMPMGDRETMAPEPAPSEAVEGREQTSRLMSALGRLPSQQQEAIRLKFQEGLSYREIASVTGHSVSNVGFLIHVGLKALRQTALTA